MSRDLRIYHRPSRYSSSDELLTLPFRIPPLASRIGGEPTELRIDGKMQSRARARAQEREREREREPSLQ